MMAKPRGIKPGYLFWTPEQDDFLREHYETTMRIRDLVAGSGGHPKDAVYKRAAQLGLSRPDNAPAPLGKYQTAVLYLAARPGGVNGAESGLNQVRFCVACASLRKRGLLFRAALGAKTVRWFTTQPAADRYLAANLAAHQAKQKPKARQARPGWGPNDPIHYPKDERGRPLYLHIKAPPPPAVVYRTNTHSPL